MDGIRKRQYGLSDDTWTRATDELEKAGLLEVDRQVFASRGEPRKRNVYKLRLETLEYGPASAVELASRASETD